jgi:glycine/D-amino acid oxidase-like deaminating enzyme/nitrite reductase/ring-hydroxylating ferredoxin subunit
MSTVEQKPIWDEVELPRFKPLSHDVDVDVAVIGAGVTGVTAAWLLKQEGFRVALLDRRQVGGVDTGCTSAHLTAVLDTDLTTLASTFGHAGAQAIWDAGLAAIDQIESLIEECQIECGFRRVPGFHHAAVHADDDTVAKEAERLRAEASLARKLGFSVEVVGSTPLMNQPGWRIDDQAIFNPRAYLKGLLRRIPGNGSIVCEQSEVTFTDVAECLACGAHIIRAPRVFVATHNPLVGCQSAVSAAFFQTNLALYTSCVLAARVKKPVDFVPGLFWDTAKPYHYVRTYEDGTGMALIAGGEDYKTGQVADTRKPFEDLEHWFKKLAPHAKVTHRWSGQVIETPDGLPFIGDVGSRQYVATGYGGNGLTFGTLAAMIVRDAISGTIANPWAELFDVKRSAIARAPFEYLRENADYPYYLVRDRFSTFSHHLRGIQRGQGRLVEIDGQLVAASRDSEGELTLLSPDCTHMGCRVNWNQAEGTWDCPCHGSRFLATGEVLAGPAEHGLERIDPPERLRPTARSGAASSRL